MQKRQCAVACSEQRPCFTSVSSTAPLKEGFPARYSGGTVGPESLGNIGEQHEGDKVKIDLEQYRKQQAFLLALHTASDLTNAPSIARRYTIIQFSCFPSPIHLTSATMDSINNSLSSSSDPKTMVINQIRQEAAMSNARQLIEVSVRCCTLQCFPLATKLRCQIFILIVSV